MGKITSLLGCFLTISFYKTVMPTAEKNTYNYNKATQPTPCSWDPSDVCRNRNTDGCSVSCRPALAYVDIMDSEPSFKILTFYFPNKEKAYFCLNLWFLKKETAIHLTLNVEGATLILSQQRPFWFKKDWTSRCSFKLFLHTQLLKLSTTAFT